MKKIFNKNNCKVLLVSAGIISLSVFNPVFSIENKPEAGVISSSGYASRLVEPDTAYINFMIITKDAGSKKAIQLNSQKATKVINSVKSMLEKDEKITTSYFILAPYYQYNEHYKKNELKGYEVSNRVLVKITRLDKIGNIIDTAVSSGADRVDNLDFKVEKSESICNQLLTEASLKAKQQAEIITRSLNVKISGIKAISSSCSTNPINRPNYMYSMKAIGGSMENTQTPIEAGEVKIDASVNIDFYL